MASLSDLYNSLVSVDEDLEKQAAEEALEELIGDGSFSESYDEETVKVASEYDAAGRLMARSYFNEMMKAAEAEVEEESKAEEEKEKKEGDEEEDEDEKKKKKGGKKLPPAFAQALAEKKAAYKQRMLEDPEFAQAMYERYSA
jgi:hypothetical protein